MKNGYTPKEFAYSMAIDHLLDMYSAHAYWLDDKNLTEVNIKQVREQISKLHKKLADTAKLDAPLLM